MSVTPTTYEGLITRLTAEIHNMSGCITGAGHMVATCEESHAYNIDRISAKKEGSLIGSCSLIKSN